MQIKDKSAVVTGAASGIGRAVSIELVTRGVRSIALVDKSEAVHDAVQAVKTYSGRDGVARAFVGDVTDIPFRTSVYDAIADDQGPASICVPAAGITRDALAVKIDKETGRPEVYPLDTFRSVVEVNLIAPVYWALEMVSRVAVHRRKRGLGRWEPSEHIEGTIVFVGSVSSQGNKGQISYATTKSGLSGAAATIMAEAIYHGVRCSVIHPGYTDTPMVQALGDEHVKERILPMTHLKRLIRADEIADAVCFMISNSAVSGELWADAGWHRPG